LPTPLWAACSAEKRAALLDDSFFRKFRKVGLVVTHFGVAVNRDETGDDEELVSLTSFQGRNVSQTCQKLADEASSEPLLNAYQHAVEAIVNNDALARAQVEPLLLRVQKMFGMSQRLHSSTLLQVRYAGCATCIRPMCCYQQHRANFPCAHPTDASCVVAQQHNRLPRQPTGRPAVIGCNSASSA